MKERIEKARKEFEKYGIDSFLAFKPSQVRYLTGLRSSSALALITPDKAYLITDFRYQEEAAAKADLYGFELIIDHLNIPGKIAEIFKKQNAIGFDENLEHCQVLKYGKKLATDKKLMPISGLVESVSAIKDDGEIADLKKAQEITERVFFNHVLPIIKPGVTENTLAAEITYQHRLHGAEGDAFDPIVLAGARSSMPHGKPDETPLKKGDLLQFDFGCVYNGYHSDFSRVVIVDAKPTKKQQKIYDIVLEAQEMAIATARPGMKYKDLDAIARGHIKSHGYGKNFGHGLGHGVGIEIHVPPYINPDESDDSVLLPGHVFTIEPGIYIPDWGGVRVEDILLVTESGVKNLTNFAKELMVI